MTMYSYIRPEFNKLLSLFQEAIDNGKYTEKIPYETWRRLKKLSGFAEIEYESPFVRIRDCFVNADGYTTRDIIYSAKTYDWGFGRFFYDYVVKKENERMTNSNLDVNIACDNTKLSLNNGTLYVKADDSNWTELGTATSATANTITDSVWGYGYSDRTTSYPSNIGTAVSITTLDDRINWLENEIQKKVDKTEKNKCVKENDTMMKGINFDFGPCGSTVRLSMYGLAVQNVSGEWVSYNTTTKEIVNVDIINMADGGKYIYKMPVAISEVQVGDIIVHAKVPMFVTGINNDGSFNAIDVRAGEAKCILATRSPFGFNFVTKVVNLFGNMLGTPTADQPFGNMLPFLMLNGENKDIDPMMMFFLMGQNGNTAINPMMWYFLSKDNKDMDPAMMWMVMSMAAGATPAFMTGNYPKAIVTSDVQK